MFIFKENFINIYIIQSDFWGPQCDIVLFKDADIHILT